MMIIWMYFECLFQHACLEIDAYLEWLIELELERLKPEKKGLTPGCFLAKQTPPAKSLACLVKWTKLYLLTGKP